MRRLSAASLAPVALRTALLGAAALGPACADDTPEGPCNEAGVVLADPTAWRIVSDADDPWGPRSDRCAASQHRTEMQADLRWHEIETRGCSAATLRQPLRADLCRGDTVELDIWHFPILEGDGDWEVRVGVGEGTAFRELGAYSVPVPRAPTTFALSFQQPASVAADTTVWLRLSNHGTNTWNLYPMVTGEPSP